MDAVDTEYHPFVYEADCPVCEASAEQAAWERNLLKGWAKATGPKTKEGMAATAKNLDGHPTPEEARLTRFNAMKHGLYARTATYFPAKPGHYPRCDGCEHLRTAACLEPPRACLKRHELLLKHQIAFETKDPDMLLQLRSDTQAGIQAIIDDMILAIAQDGGPRITEVVWYHDKDGGFHLAKWTDEHGQDHQIHELKAHPLLKPLIDYINRNAMTLEDLGMTPKVQDEQEAMQGYLAQHGEDAEAAEAYRQKSLEQLDQLQKLIGNSYAKSGDSMVIDGEVIDVDQA